MGSQFMKYLVTGGAGFIGSYLADALVARGDSVVLLDNLSTGNHHNIEHLIGQESVEFYTGSILDAELVDRLVAGVDHVIHLAAAVGVFTIVNKPLESLRVNLHGTENVLGACDRVGKPVLIASSSEIYGKNSGGALNEDSDRVIGSPLKARWSYSEAKAIDESLGYFYYSELGLPVRIVRFFNTVGPRQVGSYGMVVPRFISAALAGEPIEVYGSGEQSRCFCHVVDAVAGLLSLIDNESTVGDVFNIGNNHEISIRGLAELVISRLNSKSEIVSKSYEDAYGAGFEDMQRRIPEISKIKAATGWAPTRSLETIIDDIAATRAAL
jgi:UDP-glucose 4-epimerase